MPTGSRTTNSFAPCALASSSAPTSQLRVWSTTVGSIMRSASWASWGTGHVPVSQSMMPRDQPSSKGLVIGLALGERRPHRLAAARQDLADRLLAELRIVVLLHVTGDARGQLGHRLRRPLTQQLVFAGDVRVASADLGEAKPVRHQPVRPSAVRWFPGSTAWAALRQAQASRNRPGAPG